MGFMIHSTANHTTPPLVEAPCTVTPEVGKVLNAQGAVGTAEAYYVCMQAGPAVNGKVLAVRITDQIVFEAMVTSDPQANVGGNVGVDAAGTGVGAGDLATAVSAPMGNGVVANEPVLVVFK